MSSKILFGTDPEAFATYFVDGELYALPPYFFRNHLGVPTSKHPKHPVFIEMDEFKLHEDGAAFEMSIMPSFSPKDLFDRVQECARVASEKILSLHGEYCGPDLAFVPTAGWEVGRWKDEGPKFFMSTTFGCDPDEDVFNLEVAERPLDASLHPFRYGGGHIHFSGHPLIESDPHLAVRVLAVTAGCAAVAFSDVPDLERARTFRYGKPGKFRVQKYGPKNPFGPEYAAGIEYRTTSNRMFSSWEIAQNVLGWAERGINFLLPRENAGDIVQDVVPVAIDSILSANQAQAKSVLDYVESRI